MTDIKLNENWEAEQEAEIIAECKRDIIIYENRKTLAFVMRGDGSNNLRARAYIRHYNRKLEKARKTLALAGVEA